ncbi:MAG TPA: MFS transporter [Gammaproteobacteria bacterium]|nr:MFS transporter [Gammaproteobacteria bacterium]
MVKKREKFAWAMFDFANSGYTTVVLTAIYSTFFVGVIARDFDEGTATLLWTLTIAIANGIVLFSSPLIGAITDFSRNKKTFLFSTTLGCVVFSASLYFTGPGDVALAITLVILSSVMFFSGENIIAAFLPEISKPEHMGKLSGYGWTLGYIGGLLILGLCLAYVSLAQSRGETAEQFVPMTMLIVAICFAVASLPTFIWLKERGAQQVKPKELSYLKIGFLQLKDTWQHAHKYQDLFRFLVILMIYHCGINTVVVLAAVYAQEVMAFQTQDTIKLILVVNITAAIGAFVFGILQDKLGSLNTLRITLFIWIAATSLAFFTETVSMFWLVANLVGIALGASQSAGRALVGLFSPPARNGEFFGLWGMATKLAAIIGPLSYGLITYLTQGDHRLALLSTTLYFIAGIALLSFINEKRGRLAAGIYSREDE